MKITCLYCSRPPKYPVGPDTVEYICALCTMLGVEKRKEQEKEKLSEITKEDIKAARKSFGLTQQGLDVTLGLTTNHTNRVENGHILPDKRLFQFVKDVQDGKTPEVLNKRRNKKTKKRRKKRRKH